MGTHIINGQFQSDKYPDCPPGLIPFKATDPMAQDLLYEYAVRRREVDPEFADDLIEVLRTAGYQPPVTGQRDDFVSVVPMGDGTLKMAEVPDGFQSCSVAFDGKAIKLLDRLVNTGLFGINPSEAVERLVERELDRRFFTAEPGDLRE